MESGAIRVLDAVRWPKPATFRKTDMSDRMPIPRGMDRRAFFHGNFDPIIDDGYYLVTILDGKRAARTKVILRIDDQQCITVSQRVTSQCVMVVFHGVIYPMWFCPADVILTRAILSGFGWEKKSLSSLAFPCPPTFVAVGMIVSEHMGEQVVYLS